MKVTTVSPGVWHYWFQDKKTNEPLSSPQMFEIFEEHKILFTLPSELIGRPEVEIKVQRVK